MTRSLRYRLLTLAAVIAGARRGVGELAAATRRVRACASTSTDQRCRDRCARTGRVIAESSSLPPKLVKMVVTALRDPGPADAIDKVSAIWEGRADLRKADLGRFSQAERHRGECPARLRDLQEEEQDRRLRYFMGVLKRL